MNTNKVKVNDIEIAYREVGQGYPLIMIMGYRGYLNSWSKILVEKLAEYRRVIVFDNRGMSESGSTDKEYSIELFAEDTIQLLNALNIAKADVLGFSMGGNIALQLTVNHPEMVNNLVLYGTDCGGREAIRGKKEDLNSLADTGGTIDEIIERFIRLLFSKSWLEKTPNPEKYLPGVPEKFSPENANRQFKAIMNWKGVYNRLSEVNNKTLIITGRDDIIMPQANSHMLAEKIKNSWLMVLPGGHGLMYEYPETLSDLIIAFLEKS